MTPPSPDLGLATMTNPSPATLTVALRSPLSSPELLVFLKIGVESFFLALGDWGGGVGRGKPSEERMAGLEVRVEERIEDLIAGETVENLRRTVSGTWSES